VSDHRVGHDDDMVSVSLLLLLLLLAARELTVA